MRASLSSASLLSLALTALLGTSCGGGGVARLHVELQPDLSGTVSTTALLVPDSAGPLESQAQGTTWSDRANLYCARGTFANVGDLNVADITFTATVDGDRKSIRVTLPRGGDPAWTTAFIPGKDDRERVARTFDPEGDFGDATTHFAIELKLPGPVISSGVYPKGMRGLADETSGRRATLVVPVDRAARASEALLWDVSWK